MVGSAFALFGGLCVFVVNLYFRVPEAEAGIGSSEELVWI